MEAMSLSVRISEIQFVAMLMMLNVAVLGAFLMTAWKQECMERKSEHST